MSNGEVPAGGAPPRSLQNYSLDSLPGISHDILDVREFQLRRKSGGDFAIKELQRYPAVDERECSSGILSPALLTRLYGKNAELVRRKLTERGYASALENGDNALSWRFRKSVSDDFSLGLGEKADGDVFRSLEALIWRSLRPEDGVCGSGAAEFLRSLTDENEDADRIRREGRCCMEECEYWFRQGLGVIAVRFHSQPSPELLDLIGYMLHQIEHEKMWNYFHILSSHNSDLSFWADRTDRNERFFEIIGNFLGYAWKPFDMKTCEVSIEAQEPQCSIVSGRLRVDFSENGDVSTEFSPADMKLSSSSGKRWEFIMSGVTLHVVNLVKGSSLLSMRMLSRSPGHADPRESLLAHWFVKLFIRSAGKIIDAIISVMRREEALRNLRWRSFMDFLRLSAREHGEDLHRIVRDTMSFLRRRFQVRDIAVYSEDADLVRMMKLSSRNDCRPANYVLLDAPLEPEDLLRKQMLLFPIREVRGGRVLAYFKPPLEGDAPEHGDVSPEHYLQGTALHDIARSEAESLGMESLNDHLFFMVTECLTTNPKAVLANLSRMTVRGGGEDLELLGKVSRRVMERYSQFFDLFQTLSENLESGLAYMRGRRDNLTGLYNRTHFQTLLDELFADDNKCLGLMFIDMDNFKIFNDAVSHDFGDQLLSSLGNRMIDSAQKMTVPAVPCRFGGDEFCFSISELDKKTFETAAADVYRDLTGPPLEVTFCFRETCGCDGLEINFIGFLHRLLRPDVGSRQASKTEYAGDPNAGPRDHVVNIWKHLLKQEEKPVPSSVSLERIVSDMSSRIEDKILYNKIFPEVDEDFSRVIRMFVSLELQGWNTKRIRGRLQDAFGGDSIKRNIGLKLSAGLSHGSEGRLRSTESLFKAADDRAYLAKHNGQNCLFGVDGHRLV